MKNPRNKYDVLYEDRNGFIYAMQVVAMSETEAMDLVELKGFYPIDAVESIF